MAAEFHREKHFRPGEIPGIAVAQPVVGMLHLVAVLDALDEHAVLVADPVPVTGQTQGCHGIEEAGGKPAEPAIAQGRVHLQLADAVDVELEIGKRLPAFLVEPHVQQAVRKQAAGQELQGKIIDALGIGTVITAHGLHPALDQAFAHGIRGRFEPVAVGCGDRVLAERVDQPVGKGVFEGHPVPAALGVFETFFFVDGHEVSRMDG